MSLNLISVKWVANYIHNYDNLGRLAKENLQRLSQVYCVYMPARAKSATKL